MKIPSLLSSIYIILVLTTMVFVFLENTYVQLGLKICNIGVLIALYLIATPKEKREFLYIIILLLLLVGHINFTFPSLSSFDFTFFPYLIAHLLLILIIYRNHLKDESIKDILVFSLPFLFSHIVFSTSLLNLDNVWFFKSVFLGVATCVNCSVVLLVYANKPTIKNYLLFFGVFMWFLTDASCAIFLFNGRDEIFYFLTLILDWIAHFMICSSLIMKEKNDLLYRYNG